MGIKDSHHKFASICVYFLSLFSTMSYIGTASAFQQSLVESGENQFTNIITTEFGSSIYARDGASSLFFDFDRSGKMLSVRRRDKDFQVRFYEPDSKGFGRATVKHFYGDGAVEKQFVRSGARFVLIGTNSVKDGRDYLRSSDTDNSVFDKPRPVRGPRVCSVRDQLTNLGTSASAAAVNALLSRNVIHPSCQSKADEVASAFAQVLAHRGPGYFNCLSMLPSHENHYGNLLTALTAPNANLRITCSGSKPSSYLNSTIELGSDAFAKPEGLALRRALFHELAHSDEVGSEVELRAIESCCAGAEPRPDRCSNLTELNLAFQVLKDHFKVSDAALAKIYDAVGDLETRESFISECTKVGRSQNPARLCSLLKISADRCSIEIQPAYSNVRPQNTVVAELRDRVPNTQHSPVMPQQVTFRPGNPSLPSTFRPMIAQYQRETQAFAREAKKFDFSPIPTAVAGTRRTGASRAQSQSRGPNEVREYSTRIEGFAPGEPESLRLRLETPSGEGGPSFSFAVPFTGKEFKAAEFRAAGSEGGSDREQSSRAVPIANRGANAIDQAGASPGVAAATGGGSSAQTDAAAPASRGGRSLATDGPAAVRDNPWLDRINSPSDVRNAFKDANGDELLRNTDFVATLFQKKFRVVYKCRPHGPGDFVSLVNIDPAGSCPPPRGAN